MRGRRAGAWLQRLGVRARLTLVSSLVLAVALGAAGVLAVVVARSALLDSLDDAAAQRAQDVAGLLDAGQLSDPVPVTGAAVVQVVDSRGRVVASSPGGDRLSPLLDAAGLEAVRGGGAVALPGSRVGSGEPFRVLGLAAGQGLADTVLVATSVAEVERAVVVLTRAVALAVPVLVATMAALTWRVAGSALQPVEQLRRAAAATTPATAPVGAADRSLPVPHTRDEVARLAVTLNDMLGRLDAASARQRAFVADAAHELRSPLGSLRTQLEVALAHPSEQDWPAVAAGGVAEVERMSTLVDDLLMLARLDEGVGRFARVDVADVVTRAAAHPRRLPVRVRVQVDADGGAAVVDGDRRALARVVDNLLDNAARYARTSVDVGVDIRGAEVLVSVVDDGPGIPEADRERVFERFTRLDPARDRDAGGAGLGLAIVRAVVQRHGGTVTAGAASSALPSGAAGSALPAGAAGSALPSGAATTGTAVVVRLPAVPAPAGS